MTTRTSPRPRVRVPRQPPRPPMLTRWQQIVLAVDAMFAILFLGLLLSGGHPIALLCGLASALTSIRSVLLAARGRAIDAYVMSRISAFLVLPLLVAAVAGI